ncbi:hypothetical protein CRG98_042375 [Punica granatum]|uniref:Uncharacterized protein n=1 Tax=Punica granatum TaxID=22663 RepID=A0A2I0I059_PUNGR|nr:hypothetical protein CRG98_042375 [Punica granatum]
MSQERWHACTAVLSTRIYICRGSVVTEPWCAPSSCDMIPLQTSTPVVMCLQEPTVVLQILFLALCLNFKPGGIEFYERELKTYHGAMRYGYS